MNKNIDDFDAATTPLNDADLFEVLQGGVNKKVAKSDFIPTVSTPSLDDLTDVVITTPSTDQVLKYNGTNWVNGTDSGGGGVGQLALTYNANAGANTTSNAFTDAAQFLGNNARTIQQADLTSYTQVRLSVRVMTGNSSVNSPRFAVKYRTTFSTTVGDYIDIGASEVSCSVTTAGLITSSWINIADLAKADVFITIHQLGGDGVQTCVYSYVVIQFK